LGRCYDGRPVKLEGNPDTPVERALCAAGQASLLGVRLHRLTQPILNQRPADWDTFDRTFWSLESAGSRQKVVLLPAPIRAVEKPRADRFCLVSQCAESRLRPMFSRSISKPRNDTGAASAQYRLIGSKSCGHRVRLLGAWLPVEHGLGYRESRPSKRPLRLASHIRSIADDAHRARPTTAMPYTRRQFGQRR